MKRKTGESLSFRLKNNTSPADKHTDNRSSPVLSRVFVLLKEKKIGSPLLENSSYMRFSFKQIMPIRTLVVSRGEEEEQEMVNGWSEEDHAQSEGAYNHRRHRISKSGFVSAIRKTLGRYSASRTHSPVPTRSSVSFLAFPSCLSTWLLYKLPTTHTHIYTYISLPTPCTSLSHHFTFFLLLLKWTSSIKCTRN